MLHFEKFHRMVRSLVPLSLNIKQQSTGPAIRRVAVTYNCARERRTDAIENRLHGQVTQFTEPYAMDHEDSAGQWFADTLSREFALNWAETHRSQYPKSTRLVYKLRQR